MHQVDITLLHRQISRDLETRRNGQLPSGARPRGAGKVTHRALGAILRGFGVSAGNGASR